MAHPVVLFLFLFLILYYYLHYIITKYIPNYLGYFFLCLFQIISSYFLFSTSVLNTLIFSFVFFILLFKKNISLVEKLIFSVLSIIIFMFLYMRIPSFLDISLLLLQGIFTMLLTSHNKHQQITRAALLSSLSIVSFILLYVGHYFRILLLHVLHIILPSISYIVIPLFESIELKHGDKIIQVLDKTYGGHSEFQNMSVHSSEHSYTFFYILFWSIIIGISFYTTYRLLKRKNVSNPKEDSIPLAFFATNKSTKVKKKAKAPTDSFRLIIFRLEEQLQDPLSRKCGETLETWLFRLKELGISMNEKLIIQSYNETRYSQNKLDFHLLTSLENEVNCIIQQQKRLKKSK
ncbi:DUF4018 domain-containing protein [Bacillus cereus]|uniref:DUF4018 domain-containing protein n=1 Tax=Bacillus cereus TaxID=1396 RepID=UPI00356E8DCC